MVCQKSHGDVRSASSFCVRCPFEYRPRGRRVLDRTHHRGLVEGGDEPDKVGGKGRT